MEWNLTLTSRVTHTGVVRFIEQFNSVTPEYKTNIIDTVNWNVIDYNT